ncbi:MAG: VanW family protein [Eubacterium sp.]|nr:VanW family protein [Eubacterium sp.]
MKEDRSRKRAGFLLGLMAVVVALGVTVIVLTTRADKAAELETQAMTERVEAHRDTAFPNKWLGDEELVDRDEHYIRERLTEILETYQGRTATIRINKKHRRVYKMEDLKETISFVCNEGGEETVYPVGREAALAKHIVMIDKDLSLKDQDDILAGKRQTKKVNITIRCEANKQEITSLVKKYSKKFDKAPKNATIKSSSKSPSGLIITKEKNGRMLDTTRIARELTAYLDSNELENFSKNYQTTKVKATVKASYLEKINTEISRFSTNFISTNTRGKNIILAASRVDGKYLKPKERLSFLEVLYDDSDGKKYGKSGGFLNNKVVQVEGGGICQVSTTSYDSFLLAGIVPAERHPHTCKVSYAKPGLDAALAVGSKDLVIENTLDAPILIRARVKGNNLRVSIYSYKNAKKGFTYKLRSVTTSEDGLTVDSFLDKYKDGVLVDTQQLATDKYKKLRG